MMGWSGLPTVQQELLGIPPWASGDEGKEGAASNRKEASFLRGTEEGNDDGLLQAIERMHERWSAAAKSDHDEEGTPFWWKLKGVLGGYPWTGGREGHGHGETFVFPHDLI
jgi:hypothetical protein